MTERKTLYDGEDVTLRQYQSGEYGLTVHGLRIKFSSVRIPIATNIHVLEDENGNTVGDIRCTDLPHEVSQKLGEI